MSSTGKDAQPPAGAEEGRGDSSQDQSHVTRPAEQAEGKEGCSVCKNTCLRYYCDYYLFTHAVYCML